MRVLFIDFGGTLDGDGLHWSTQMAQAFASAGLTIARPELDRAFVASDRYLETLPEIARAGFERHVRLQVEHMLELLHVAPSGSEPIVSAFMSAARSCLERNRLVLTRHRAHFRYWVISNFTANLPLIVEETGLSELIDGTSCSALVGMTKPHPGLFRAALRDSGYAADQAVMVGDSLANDIVPAKALGFSTLWIRRDEMRGGDPAAADYIAPDLASGFALLEAARLRGSSA
jgi:FMN hydrolase / 5-amino-6-(5-phospho-D-ribitylamino)uracil phosphatase